MIVMADAFDTYINIFNISALGTWQWWDVCWVLWINDLHQICRQERHAPFA
jgi:hypothetical protein